MRRVFVFSLLAVLCGASIAAELPNSLFGIALGAPLDALQGTQKKGIGIVRNRATYYPDTAIYVPDPPFKTVVVMVDRDSQRIMGIIGMVLDMTSEQCQVQLQRVKAAVEKRYRLTLAETRRGRETYYLIQSDDTVLAVDCDEKRDRTILRINLSRV